MKTSTMAELAKLECLAARRKWSVGDGWVDPDAAQPRNTGGKNIPARIVPFIGSGRTQVCVARELGCSKEAVNQALKRLGKKL